MNHEVTTSGEFLRHLELPLEFSQTTTVGEIIRCHAAAQADHPAITSSDFAPMSYCELQSLIDQVRASLRSQGFGRTARIAIAMPNVPQAALAIVAVSCSAVSVPLNPRQTVREVEICLAVLRPDAILLMKGSDSAARRAAEHEGLTIIEAVPSKNGALDFSIEQQQSKARSVLDDPDEPDPAAPAFILQTSGTAAEPKLIPFSHRNMLAVAARIQAWFDLTQRDRCLSVSPPYYSHGLKVTVLTPLLTGGTVAFPADAAKFDYSEWFGVLKPTWYSAGPTLHRLIFDQTNSRADAKTGHSLQFITGGGAPLPAHVLEGLQHTLGVPVAEHYGSSEAALVASNQLPPRPFKAGTCGMPWPGTLIITGEDGSEVPRGEKGEIVVGGPSLISGYLEAPELNRECFVEGWFKTGDIGCLDEQGFLTVHGRKNDLINRGGEKISPAEIDKALMGHPAVAEAAAFPLQHARLGEDVAAAVVLHPGMVASAIELRRYLQDQLASFKIPGRIIIEDRLPKGKTGKVLRRELSESFKKRTVVGPRSDAPPQDENTTPDSALVIQLTEIWERLLQTASISLDDEFSESGGDSLLAMEMLAELERLIGKSIPVSILFEARTIRQLAQKLSDLDSLQSERLIKINASGSAVPLFLFHGDYGGGLYAVRLAKKLGSDQPLFIIPPHGLGNEAIPRSIEAMAADRLPLVQSAQPKGPYRLCGYCNGGIVALEVARMLLAAGEKVEMVGIIDFPTVGAHSSFKLFALAMSHVRPIFGSIADRAVSWAWHRCLKLERFLTLSTSQRWDLIRDGVGQYFGSAGGQSLSETSSYGGALTAPRGMYRALAMHSPAPLGARIVYFSAEYGSVASRRLSPDIEVVKIGNDHRELIRNPADLAELAYHLRSRLKRRESSLDENSSKPEQ